MSAIPGTQRAVKINKEHKLVVLDNVPVSTNIEDNEILVKVRAAALNHADFYFADFKWASPGTGSGTCLAGDVVAVGKGVTRFKVGDTITSFTFGSDSQFQDHGAFQQYAKVLETNSFQFGLKGYAKGDEIERGPLKTYEEGASVANALITIGISIYHTFGHTNESNKTILIYGGSTNVGQLTIQYVHNLGWRIITIASPRYESLLKGLGADVVLDYHSETLVDDIKNLNEPIDFAYVTTGGQQSVKAVYEALPEGRPIQLEGLQVPDITYIEPKKSNVHYEMTRAFTSHEKTIIYADGKTFGPKKGTVNSLKEFIPIVEKLNKDGKLEHLPIKVLPGGFDAVDKGLDLLREGKVSNQHLIIRVNEEEES